MKQKDIYLIYVELDNDRNELQSVQQLELGNFLHCIGRYFHDEHLVATDRLFRKNIAYYTPQMLESNIYSPSSTPFFCPLVVSRLKPCIVASLNESE